MRANLGSAGAGRRVALTFDDGPNPETTPRLLDVLARHAVKATFFVVGHEIGTPLGRGVMERAHREGHHIGNHGYSHRDLRSLAEREVRDEARRAQDLIGGFSHARKFFRPPYGFTNATVRRVLDEDGYTTVFWTADSLDWKISRGGAWVDRVVELVGPQRDPIVLMHDVHPTTVDHVGDLVSRLRELEPVEFVQLDDPRLAVTTSPPAPWSMVLGAAPVVWTGPVR